MTTRLRAGEAGEIAFVLDLPIGINTRHTTDPRTGLRVRQPGQYVYRQTTWGARPVKSAAARRWIDAAALLIRHAVATQGWRDPGGPLAVELRRSGSRADLDSGIKLALDGIAAGLGVNDARFAHLAVYKQTRGAPCLTVTVRPWRAADGRAA